MITIAFELLSANIGHLLRTSRSLSREIKRTYFGIEEDENRLGVVENMYREAFSLGDADKVTKAMNEGIRLFSDSEKKVIHLESDFIIITLRIMNKYFSQVRELAEIESKIDHIEYDKKNELKKAVSDLAFRFRKEVDDIFPIINQVARISVDELQSLKNDSSHERLRDKAGAMIKLLGETRSRFSARLLKRDIKEVFRYEKDEERTLLKLLADIDKLIQSVRLLSRGVSDDAKKNIQSILDRALNDIKKAFEGLDKEDHVLNKFFDDMKFVILFAVRHFFHLMLSFKNLEKHLVELKGEGFFEDILKNMKDNDEHALMELASEAHKEMRMAYQELNKIKDLRSETERLAA